MWTRLVKKVLWHLLLYLDISEVADNKFILVDTGTPVKNIFLMFRDQSHPVIL